MSGNQENQAFIRSVDSPADYDGGFEEEVASPTACGFSAMCCFRSAEGSSRPLICWGAWWRRKAERVRELSELAAGPKWKNLLRKVGRYFHRRVKGGYKAQFLYDAQSYALNFDNGAAAADEDDGLLRNFSSRYAAPTAGQQRKAGL